MKKKLISLFVSLTIMSTIMPIIPVSASATIQLGDYVQMGEYYGEPILWRCVAFEKISGYDDDGNPIIDSTDTVTEYKSGYLPLMLSDKILCIKPFDVSGTDLSGSHGRGYVENGISGYWRQNSYGSNYWGDSNIRCWLNSDCTSGNVLYTCGNIPNSEKLEENAYADEAGFLHDFTNTEKELVEKVSQKSILDGFEYSQDINNNYHRWGSTITDCVQNYSTSFSEYITDKMFLLDVKQINTVYNNRDVLGNDYYIGKPTQNCIDNTEYENEDLSIEKGWYNWLRTPDAHLYYPHRGSRNVRGIHIGGEISNAGANNPSFGIRPAFFLNLQTANFVSGSGTENSPYNIDNSLSDFELNKYRAEFLLNDTLGSTMENTYFNFDNTPSKILYEGGIDSGLYNSASLWKAVTDIIDSFDSPSNLLDYAFEEKDVYSAIIFNIFESATDYKVTEFINNDITKGTKNLVSTVTSTMKNLYNYDMLNGFDISKLDDAGKENLKKAIEAAYKQEHGDAAAEAKLTKVISNGIEYAKDLESYCEMVETYYNIRCLSDSMKQVMQKMRDKCPLSEPALRTALSECVVVMNSSEDAFAAEMTAAFFGVVGKDASQIMIDKMWDNVKIQLYMAHPQIYVLMSAYKVGKYASNVLFNSDEITEKYFKLAAVVKAENLLDTVYSSIKSDYNANKTEENAEVYNSVVDIMFNALDTDCDYAYSYADSVGSEAMGKLNAALGNTSVEDIKNITNSQQNRYSIEHACILTAWIYKLENDYPEIYPQYEQFINDIYTRVVKKYNISCPVDVYVYNSDGVLEGSVVNNIPYCSDDKNITVEVNGDKKTLYFYNDEEYNIVYVGNDTGTMDIAIAEYDDSQNETRNVYFNNIELTDGLTYSSSESSASEKYTLVDESSNNISADYDTQNAGDTTYTATLTRGYFSDFALSSDLYPNENAEIKAYVPDGYKFVGWTSDAGEDIFENADSVTTTICMPAYDVNITANIDVLPIPEIMITPIANTLTYTGEPQELITAGTAGGGTMQYSLDGENYSADIPTAVNAGEYTVYYKVVGDEGYNDTVPDTIDVTIEPSQEDTPCIEIDFENEMLTGFDTGSYTIDEVSIVPTENNLAIDSYIGETISIIKKASDENHADSEPQLLEIPARPSAPKEDMFTVTQPQIIGGTGTIEGITATMEYSTDNGMTWTTGSGANITDIAGGTTYVVRYKANENHFKSDKYLIAIKIFGATDEAIPDIAIDYINETLTGFAENGNYTINGISVTPADGKLNIADYIGKTISIVKKGNGTTTNDSEAQVLAIPLRPSIPTAFEVIQPSIIDGTGTIKGISADMEYSSDNGLTWTNGNGSDITEIAGGTKYLIRVKSTDNSFKSDSYSVTITAFVAEPEQTPNVGINYADEILTGFDNGNYTINGTEVTATDGKVNISPEWIGTTILIVKKGTDTTIDSNVQSLDIPARPSALNVTASPVTARGRSDGKIVGVTTDMEYKLSDSEIWLDCTDIEITGLVAGTYDVRVKSSDSSFSGIITKVEVDTECIKIIAEYTADGILEDIKVEKINISEITTSQNTTTNKVFYWETLENMKPITLTERY